jgi:hypothetical protein
MVSLLGSAKHTKAMYGRQPVRQTGDSRAGACPHHPATAFMRAQGLEDYAETAGP